MHRLIGLGELLHAHFNGRQVLRSERPGIGKVVIKAIFNHRPDGHLRIREQLLDRLREQVRGRMPDDLETIGVAVGDHAQARVVIDQKRGVDQLAVDTAGQRRARQPRADTLCDFSHAYGAFKAALAAVRQGDDWH